MLLSQKPIIKTALIIQKPSRPPTSHIIYYIKCLSIKNIFYLPPKQKNELIDKTNTTASTKKYSKGQSEDEDDDSSECSEGEQLNVPSTTPPPRPPAPKIAPQRPPPINPSALNRVNI